MNKSEELLEEYKKISKWKEIERINKYNIEASRAKISSLMKDIGQDKIEMADGGELSFRLHRGPQIVDLEQLKELDPDLASKVIVTKTEEVLDEESLEQEILNDPSKLEILQAVTHYEKEQDDDKNKVLVVKVGKNETDNEG